MYSVGYTYLYKAKSIASISGTFDILALSTNERIPEDFVPVYKIKTFCRCWWNYKIEIMESIHLWRWQSVLTRGKLQKLLDEGEIPPIFPVNSLKESRFL